MCSAIEYQGRKVYFRDENPWVPVLRKRGLDKIEPEVRWMPWGTAFGQRGQSSTALPEGPCARHESIKNGKWLKWHSHPVQIRVDRFMERSKDKAEHWFDLKDGEVIQGCLAEGRVAGKDVMAVYVVTVPAPPEFAHIHERWPRIVSHTAP